MKVDDEVVISPLYSDRIDELVNAQIDIFADYIIPLRSSPQFFREFMRSVGGRLDDIIVATQRDRIVGYVNPVVDQKEAWVGGLGVIPSHRGQGVGTKLMEAAEEAVRRRGVDEMILEVIEGNSSATRLYTTMGYVEHRSYLSADGKAARFAGFGRKPESVGVEEVADLHRATYADACWQKRKASALVESGRTCETYAVDGGFVMLRRVGTTGFVPFIGVLPEKRKRGIGTSLAKFALDRLWELGAFKVAIYNVNDDLPTKRMLDKFDFAVTLRQIEMRKPLD